MGDQMGMGEKTNSCWILSYYYYYGYYQKQCIFNLQTWLKQILNLESVARNNQTRTRVCESNWKVTLFLVSAGFMNIQMCTER